MTTTALINANVLDVTRGEVLGEHSVVIENDRIREITTGSIQAERRVDLKGHILMPGLCDGHVHVTAATADFALLGSWSPTYVAARAGEILEGMLMRGFTTVRDAGGADHGLAQALDEGYLTGPRILYAGKALSQKLSGLKTAKIFYLCMRLERASKSDHALLL